MTKNTARRFTKADIEYHSTTPSGHYPVPAVNVKVYKSTSGEHLPFSLGGVSENGGPMRQVMTHPLFTHDWIEEHVTERDEQGAYEAAIEDGWSQIKSEAEEIFGPGTKVYSEGRSGGWAYVDGFRKEDVESWGAIEVSRWGRWARRCRVIADDVPHMILWNLYTNVFEPWLEEQRTEATEALADDVTAEKVRMYVGGQPR